jgi:hypothetical protein
MSGIDDEVVYGKYSLCGNCDTIIPIGETFCSRECEEKESIRLKIERESFENSPEQLILKKYKEELNLQYTDILKRINEDDETKLLRVIKIILSRDTYDKGEAIEILDLLINKEDIFSGFD